MSWNCYLTIFEVESPVHMGYKQIGILKTTRYYITGRAMWGAITANLTRALFDNPDMNNYREVGDFVKENIKTTYFFPAIKSDEKSLDDLTDVKIEVKVKNDKNEKFGVFLPRYKGPKEKEDSKDVGIKFGKLSKEKFEQVFIGSFVSTALDATTKTAEEGSLHEFEFIKNRVKIVKSKEPLDVYWIGYIFAKEGVELNGIRIQCNDNDVLFIKDGHTQTSLSEVFKLIYVGGERNYGLGRLKLHDEKLYKLAKENNGKIFGEFDFELSDEKIILKSLSENSAIAISHVKLNGIELKFGEIEPLVGLEWDNKGAGQKVSSAEICATPGSKLKAGNFVLCDYGILSSV